jgi:hypothetical protein
LRGAVAGGATISLGLPTLEAMLDDRGTAYADGSDLPCRFGLYYWGNGILHSAWVPSQTGTSWELPHSLRPFAALSPELRSYLTLVTGTNHRGSSPGHIPAHGIALSSSHDSTWVQRDAGPGYRNHTFPEPSIDVIVRDAYRGQALRDWVGVQVTNANPYEGDISWEAGGRVVNEPERSPRALFDRLFSAGLPDSGTEEGAMRRALEASMLDAVLEDFRSLRGRLPTADAQRLEAHMDGLRSIERQLQDLESGGGGMTCALPGEPGSGATMREKAELLNEILAVGLACDLTRVISYEWSSHQSNFVYSELGISVTHHNDISHSLENTTRQGEKRQVMELIMHGLADLAERLRNMTEPNGETVLDRTLLLATSEHANADRHDYRDHPFLFVGGACGRLRRGQHWRHPDPGNNYDAPNVLLTAVRAAGVARNYVGMEGGTDSRGRSYPDRRATTPIAELLT